MPFVSNTIGIYSNNQVYKPNLYHLLFFCNLRKTWVINLNEHAVYKIFNVQESRRTHLCGNYGGGIHQLISTSLRMEGFGGGGGGLMKKNVSLYKSTIEFIF